MHLDGHVLTSCPECFKKCPSGAQLSQIFRSKTSFDVDRSNLESLHQPLAIDRDGQTDRRTDRQTDRQTDIVLKPRWREK